MAGVQTSPQPSSSTSAAFVDAEDIWRSAAPSISSSSRNSVAVIPPHFPPPRGFNRLVEILRSKIPSLLKNRSKDIYRDYSVPGVLAAKPHVSYHNQPPPSLPAHINVSFSTVPKSDSSSPRRLPRPRHRTRRSRRTAAQSSTSGQSFSANISPHDINLPPSPVVSKRPPSSLRGRSSSRRTGAGIATVGVNPQKLTINTSSMAAPGKPCLCLPSEPVGVGAEPHTEDSKARLQSAERFRVFSLGGELAYVDAGRPYEETLRLAQRAYPPLQNVPPDRIQFFLPCGVAERARVPEDAWQGMIRRTGSLDRVYIHVRPEEASEEGNTVAVAGDISGREDSGEQASDGDSVS